MSLSVAASSRQPARDAWPIERLLQERAIALGMAFENSTAGSYQSHLNSYLSFCSLHCLPINPTPDTLSFYVVYMSAHIKPSSVKTYLTGIINNLEPYYPDARKNRLGALVTRTLAGCIKLRGTPAQRKLPLAPSDLKTLLGIYLVDPSYDDQLFLAMTFVGFHGLNRLGELVANDNPAYRSSRKAIKRHTLQFHDQPSHLSFTLPMHKADRFYDGSTIVIQKQFGDLDPLAVVRRYLDQRDVLHLWHPLLWVRESGQPPTRSWYVERLRRHFGSEFAGHSLRAGGATALAVAGVSSERIKLAGRWSSDTFQIYIRKNPMLLQAIMGSRPSLD